jgi:hypothetical protein
LLVAVLWWEHYGATTKLIKATIFSRLGNSLNVTVGTGQSITIEGVQTAEGFAEWTSMNMTAGRTYVFVAEV